MIEGENITKTFGDLTLFRDFSFRIGDGDFVCFSGASGKGKTTLLNIIGQIEPIDGGRLLIDGARIESNRQKLDFFRSTVGFLFQNFALIEGKTVRQNLEIIKKSGRTGHSIREVLEMVGLGDKMDSRVFTLSGGEQQRVALARLFLKKCSIILADEPTGSLDPVNAQIVMGILLRMNQAGKTVVVVTHDEKIKGMAGKVIEL